MNRIGAIIADIHIGVIDDDIMIRELDEIFFNKINEYKLDFVIMAGDLFDKQIKVNGKGFKSLSVFIVKLVEYCCNNNTKLRIIQGTYSHDLDQLKYVDALLSVYFNNHNLDYKLIYSVTSEELFDNLKILYIPEEYIEDKKEYYKDYLYNDNKYDIVVGHGVIEESMSVAVRNMNKDVNKRLKAPIFKSKELDNVCSCVFFGHYHVHDEYYIGSFTRWVHNEEEEKGFILLSVDENISDIFITNHLAKTFKTINIDFDENVYVNIKDTINEDKYDNLRINIVSNNIIDSDNRKQLESIIKIMDKGVKLKINDNKKDIKDDIEIDEDLLYILDENINDIDKIHRFIHDKLINDEDVEISKSFIDDAIN